MCFSYFFVLHLTKCPFSIIICNIHSFMFADEIGWFGSVIGFLILVGTCGLCCRYCCCKPRCKLMRTSLGYSLVVYYVKMSHKNADMYIYQAVCCCPARQSNSGTTVAGGEPAARNDTASGPHYQPVPQSTTQQSKLAVLFRTCMHHKIIIVSEL